MITFKQYLKEDISTNPFAIAGKPAWTESLSTMLFDLPRAGFKDVKIPISPAIFRRIWPKPVRTKVFHLTDFDGVKKVIKMQGGKRSISAFFNMDDIVIETGIKSEGGFVLEMMADVLAASQDDMSSQPDKTGRRWMTFSTLMNKPTDSDPGLGGATKLKRMENDIKEMLIKIIVDHSDITPVPNVNKAWGYLGKSVGGKEKSLIIKDYLDGMEKVMKKYAKPLGTIFTDYVKKRIQKPDPDSWEKPMWDELVVNNFTIEKVHVVTGDDPEDWDETDFGLPIKVWSDRESAAAYIRTTVSKIKL